MNINAINPVTTRRPVANTNNVEQSNIKQFSDTFKNALDNINKDIDLTNDSLHKAIVGDSEHYLDYLIQTEKNSMNLQVTLQLRNKVVDAYNEIMRMQL